LPRAQEVAGSNPAALTNSGRNHQSGWLIGRAAETVLKAVRTKPYGDRDLSHPPTRKTNRSGCRRRLESVRHAFACEHRALSLPPFCFRHLLPLTGKSTGRASGTRSKRAGTERCGDQDLGFPPFRAEQDDLREVPIRTGWCRRCAVNAVPLGQEVQFHPLPTMRT
jgi:hypothetical protein